MPTLYQPNPTDYPDNRTSSSSHFSIIHKQASPTPRRLHIIMIQALRVTTVLRATTCAQQMGNLQLLQSRTKSTRHGLHTRFPPNLASISASAGPVACSFGFRTPSKRLRGELSRSQYGRKHGEASRAFWALQIHASKPRRMFTFKGMVRGRKKLFYRCS